MDHTNFIICVTCADCAEHQWQYRDDQQLEIIAQNMFDSTTYVGFAQNFPSEMRASICLGGHFANGIRANISMMRAEQDTIILYAGAEPIIMKRTQDRIKIARINGTISAHRFLAQILC